MENPLLVFISSIMNPQKDDLRKERDAAKEAINSILPTLSWRFEDSPASSERVDHFYFNKVKECDIFLIILGQEITEPVESEYGTAKDSDKPKLTFLKKGVMRSQALQDFIKKIDVKYAEFETSDDLRERIREAVRDELIQGYKKFRISREEKSWLETFKALPDVKVFFGREKEIEDLYRMIHERRSKVIAITGQGGTGKSALAAKLLEELAKRNESFEAISWQSLRYKPTFDLIIDDLIITLSKEITQEDIGRAETEKKINLLIRLLNQKCCLVVLDNLETIFKSGDEANVGKCEDPNYGTLLKALTESAHESQVIITSRETPTEASKKLQDFQPYPPNGITGIDYQSAVKLIRSQSLDGTEEEFKILAEKYRGHPLALILVAGMIREDYNGKVERFKMKSLVVEGIDELIEEQFKRLSEPERRLLYRISVFREVVPFEALMALGEGSSEKEIKEIRELARKLRRRSLLNYEFLNEVETYDLHPLVEEYAYERLEDKIKAHRLAYNYYISLKLKPREERRTLADVQSLIEAHYHACSVSEYDEAFEIISNNPLYEDLALWGYSRAVVELYEKLLPEDWKSGGRKLSKLRSHGAVISNLGTAYSNLGEVNKAISYYYHALEIFKEIGDKENEGRCLGNLGDAYRNLGEVDRAIPYLKQALSIFRETGSKTNEGRCLGNLGSAYSDLGEVNEAISYYYHALKIAKEIEDKRSEGICLGNLGLAFRSFGEIKKAISCLEEALKIAKEIGDKNSEGLWLGNLAGIYFSLGEIKKANLCCKQAIKIAREINDSGNEGLWLCNLAGVHKDQESNELVLACLLESAKILKEIGDPQLSHTNKCIEHMKQTLDEEEFAKLESEVQANLARFLQEATGIERWEG